MLGSSKMGRSSNGHVVCLGENWHRASCASEIPRSASRCSVSVWTEAAVGLRFDLRWALVIMTPLGVRRELDAERANPT